MTYRHSLTVIGLLYATVGASAQEVPRVSLSVLGGSSRTHGGEFQVSDGLVRELAGTVRLTVVSRVALLATAAVGDVHWTGLVETICIPSAHGGCKPSGAILSGTSARVGLEGYMAPRLILGGSAGFGWYNGRSHGARGAHVVPLELSAVVPVVSHLGLIARAERMDFRDFGGESFHYHAMLVGVRVQ